PPTPTLFPYTTLFRSLPLLCFRLESSYPNQNGKTMELAQRAAPKAFMITRRGGITMLALRTFAALGAVTAALAAPAHAQTTLTRSEEHTSELQSLRHL